MRDYRMRVNPDSIISLSPSVIPLSQAIMLGSVKRPQTRHGFFERDGHKITATCAISAAFDAIGIIDRMEKEPLTIRIADVWPILRKNVPCPVCGKLELDLGTSIMCLHDDHGWTRPQVAEWVAGIEAPQTPTVETQKEEIMK